MIRAKFSRFGFFVVLITMSSFVKAGIIEWSTTFDQVSGDSFLSSVAHPTFTGDFSVDKQLRVTFSAPTGKQFETGPQPVGSTYFRILADIWSGDFVSNHTLVPGVSVSFEDLQGSLDSMLPFEAAFGDSGNFYAGFYGELESGGISFTSISMLFDVSTTFNEVFTNHTLGHIRFKVNTDVDASVAISDIPAQVPSPATITLLGLGLIGLGWSRRKEIE